MSASRWGPGKWPTEEECLSILKESGASREVVAHCGMAARIAVAIANTVCKHSGTGVDIDLVKAGALLHDIGRARDHGIRHAILGAELADSFGLPPEIHNIIERHLGAGVEASEAVKLGLPARDYIPITLEEKIVAHADNLAGKRGKVPLEKVLRDLERKGASHVIPRMKALHRELSELCGIDLDELDV